MFIRLEKKKKCLLRFLIKTGLLVISVKVMCVIME